MNDKQNGSHSDQATPGGAVTGTLIRNVIPMNPGLKIVYTLSNGAYLGTLTVEASAQDALRTLVDDFHSFIHEQTSGLALARGGLPPGAFPGRR